MEATKPTLRDLLRQLPPSSPALRRDQLITLAANLGTLVLAVWQQWSLAALIWPYWIQSVAIGAFNTHRMLSLQRFSTDGLTSGNQPVPVTVRGKGCSAAFFCLHYGFFHLVYFVFLAAVRARTGEWRWILFGAAVLVLAQALAHLEHLRRDARGQPNLGDMMLAPYLRILPIHLTILFGLPFAIRGDTGIVAVLLFGALKTWADHWGIRIEDAANRSGTANHPGARPLGAGQ